MSISDSEVFDLQQLINSSPKVLLDFWTKTCVPCRKMAPILEKLAAEMKELHIVKIDAEEKAELVEQLNVKGVPTLILYLNGAEKGRKQGFVPPAELRRWLGETA